MLRRAVGTTFRRALEVTPQALGARLSYLKAHGRRLNLARPTRFNEFVFRQKLFGDHATFADLSDKVRVKDYVVRKLGPSFVVPTLWHGPALPPREERDWPTPFVLKANHGSGMNAFVREPRDRDWDQLEAKAAQWLATGWPAWLQERWYDRIERQLLVEPMLGNGTDDVPDYKVYVFSGRALLIDVHSNRLGDHTAAFYDRDWTKQPVVLATPMHPGVHARPLHLEQMLEAAEQLGQGFEFVRVDLYDLPGGPRFGEMTFAPASGLVGFKPDSYEVALGQTWAREATTGTGPHTGRVG